MRRTFISTLFVLLFSAFVLSQDQDYSKVEIKVQKVADGVYMLQGAGGNIGVSVGDDGIVMIDDQFAPLAPKIQALKERYKDDQQKYGVEQMRLRGGFGIW